MGSEPLEELLVDQNRLTALPEALGDLSQLRDLNLTGNTLRLLPDSLGRLCSLQNVSQGILGNAFFF